MTEGQDGIASVHDGGDGFSIGKLAGAATSPPGGLARRAPGDGALSLAGAEMAPPWQPQESRASTTGRSDQPSQASYTVPVPRPQLEKKMTTATPVAGGSHAAPGVPSTGDGATELTLPTQPHQSHASNMLTSYHPSPSPATNTVPVHRLHLQKMMMMATPVAGGSHRAPVFPSTSDGASSSTERRHDSVSPAEEQTGKTCLELSICVDDVKGHKRKRSRNPWILCLPDDLMVKILVLHTRRTDLNNLMASSFLFLRASLLPCPCHSLGHQPRLVAALVQTKRGLLKVAAIDGPRLRWLEPAASMLNKFLNLVFHSRGWLKPIDCRYGTIAVIKDSQAKVVELLRPFEGHKITTLPEAPCYDAEDMLTGGLIPGESGAFRFFLLSRIRGTIEQLSLKTFSSATGLWDVQQMSFPFLLSRRLAPRGVFASGRHYVLDHNNLKLLSVDIESHTADGIVLPAERVQCTLCNDNNTLALSRGGELYWIVLDGFFFKFFMLSGSDWLPRLKRMIPDHVPSNMHTVQLVGHSASNGVVLMRCSHQVFAIDIENGSLVKFKDCRDGSCTFFAFEIIQHVIADHVHRM
ncbi:hypothetical protein ZWY2020_013018 [Hordeum vulgare]|nr:hypothetical protein ZWY2020_013018 [Hordeum vulgare]